MLLQIENAGFEKIKKLMDFADSLNLHLRLIDENANDHGLPGKPLSEQELTDFINKSRGGGTIDMQDAHIIIRNSFNAG